MRPLLFALLPFALLACHGKDQADDSGKTDDSGDDSASVDQDDDGYDEDVDCDDLNAAIHPDATEVCDGVDNNCDDQIDEGVAGTWYPDADEDGYGDDSAAESACTQPDGYTDVGGDCDDADPAYNPGASETDCSDPNDYNCDGSTGYDDADSDGYPACEECDDADADINPAASESCDGVDDDCDGEIDEAGAIGETTWYADDDADTYGDPADGVSACDAPVSYVADATDCDDGAAGVNPGADELCDEVDDDCDGEIDEAGAVDEATWYYDGDSDGYGDASVSEAACTQPDGYVEYDTDCDDGDPAFHPGATETCDDPTDYNCDGSTSYEDLDGDGFPACEECDDSDAGVSPEATETCDGVDDDCDGTIDEDDAADAGTWYADADADDYGDATSTTTACEAPEGYVPDSTDCDDGRATVNPGADEVCDGLDDDCDGSTDEIGAVDGDVYYEDSDVDGYGDAGSSVLACSEPDGYGVDDTDCDDSDGGVHPGASETCDGVDEDCDGAVDDDATDASTWYADGDDDGYGDLSSTARACTTPSGYTSNHTDCDDADGGIHPGADELCNDVDDDCDGTVDDAAIDRATWYVDTDSDGFGTSASTKVACDKPSGYAETGDDCDDADDAVYPSAPEVCGDGTINDCDGTAATATDACAIDGAHVLGDDAWTTLEGEAAADYAGFAVARAGDTDGDGLADFLVGANHNSTRKAYGGAAYLWRGAAPVGTVGLATADAIFYGEGGGDEAGQALAPGGDLDGDGYDDLMIAAPKADQGGSSNTGTVYLELAPFSGIYDLESADAVLIGELAGDVAGRSVQPAGDWDGDGVNDVAIGAAGDDTSGAWAGKAYVVLGPVAGTYALTDAAAEFTGEATYDYAGRWMAGGADLDGDGTPDLAIGAYGADDAGASSGAAYVIYGPVTGTNSLSDADVTLTGEAAGDQAGRAVATVDDSDGDGLPELLIGAWASDRSARNNPGSAYLFKSLPTGSASVSTADLILTGANKADNFGIGVDGAGDVDGDGQDDLLVGARAVDGGATDAGGAYVFLAPFGSGTLSAAAADISLYSDKAGANAGWAVAGAGDVNGDGADDVLIGAYLDDTTGTDAGEAWLIGWGY